LEKSNSTVLMVFSLSASVEVGTKAIFGKKNNELSIALQDAMICQVEKLVSKIDIPVVWYDEELQKGNSFGERYARAFQDLYDQGYENVISIGNDCLDLTSQILSNACDSLSNQGVVWGPAFDGGVYLLGFRKTKFDKIKFQNLPWQTSSLLETLIQCFDNGNNNNSILPKLVDVDDLATLKVVISRNRLLELRFLLEKYFGAFIIFAKVKNDFPHRVFFLASH
jgi:uncharacterized protein